MLLLQIEIMKYITQEYAYTYIWNAHITGPNTFDTN